MTEGPPRLTARQRELMLAVEAYQDEHGFFPTLREMATAMGGIHVTGVLGHLRALARKEYMARDGGHRSWRILRRVGVPALSAVRTRRGVALCVPRRPLSDDEASALAAMIQRALEGKE
jgi:SOS-response transcriptional repressor LexA